MSQDTTRRPWGWAYVHSPLTASVCIGERCPADMQGLPNVKAVFVDAPDEAVEQPAMRPRDAAAEGRITEGPLRLFEVGDTVTRLCPADAKGQSLPTVVEEGGTPFAAVLNDADARLFAGAKELYESTQLLLFLVTALMKELDIDPAATEFSFSAGGAQLAKVNAEQLLAKARKAIALVEGEQAATCNPNAARPQC